MPSLDLSPTEQWEVVRQRPSRHVTNVRSDVGAGLLITLDLVGSGMLLLRVVCVYLSDWPLDGTGVYTDAK